MKRPLKALLASVAFVSLAILLLHLASRCDGDSDIGSLIRTALGGFLAGLTLAWGSYLIRLARSDKVGRRNGKFGE